MNCGTRLSKNGYDTCDRVSLEGESVVGPGSGYGYGVKGVNQKGYLGGH